MTAGTAVVVWRRTDAGLEFLVLHRAHFDAEFAGDWAWGPPGGLCDEGEAADACAARELHEETGLHAACVATDCGEESSRILGVDFRLFGAEVSAEAEVALSWEHDAYRWLPLDEARSLCRPAYVADGLACVAGTLRQR